MSVDLTKGATVELVKTLSDDLRTKSDSTKWESAGAAIRAHDAEITNVKNDLRDSIDALDTIRPFLKHDDFVNGNISTAGTPSTNVAYFYQIFSIVMQRFESDCKITIDDGWRIRLKYYSSDVMISDNQTEDLGFINGPISVTVPKNQWFAFVVSKNPMDTNTPVDVETGLSHIMVNGGALDSLIDDVEDAQNDIATLNALILPSFNPGDFKNGNISTAGTPSTSDAYFYQIFSSTMQRFGHTGKLIIDEGWRIRLKYYSSDVMISANQTEDLGFINGPTEVIIPEMQWFALCVSRFPVDTTTPLDVETGLSHVRVCDAIDVLYSVVDNIESRLDGSVPEYWKTYADEKLPELHNAEISVGRYGVEFAFITDVHIPRNSMHSPEILHYLYNNMNFPFVINGGDLLDTDSSKSAAVEHFYLWREKMKGLPEYCVIGNHDLNSLSQEDITAILTKPEYYRMMISPTEWEISDVGNCYYVLDNKTQKFRFIIVSTDIEENNAEGTWLKAKLTELASDWTVLVITHYMWASTTESFHPVGTRIINAINSVFANINANFVGILAGHTHADYAIKESTNGYNIIATTCDTRSGEYTRTVGTTSEQAFDLVFINTESKTITMKRIGAGSDRSFTY